MICQSRGRVVESVNENQETPSILCEHPKPGVRFKNLP